jgi:hypothetical protein
MQHPVADALNEMLRGQESARRGTVTVEAFTDPNDRYRRVYRLTGHSKAAVQEAITARMTEAEGALFGGAATFDSPFLRRDGMWCSTGEVVLFAEAAE